MTSKKTAKSKRASPPREFTRTKEFKKDWQRLAHSGRYDLNGLEEAMLCYSLIMPHRYQRNGSTIHLPGSGRTIESAISVATFY